MAGDRGSTTLFKKTWANDSIWVGQALVKADRDKGTMDYGHATMSLALFKLGTNRESEEKKKKTR